eukprot:5788335-Amphidinium_carterae.2
MELEVSKNNRQLMSPTPAMPGLNFQSVLEQEVDAELHAPDEDSLRDMSPSENLKTILRILLVRSKPPHRQPPGGDYPNDDDDDDDDGQGPGPSGRRRPRVIGWCDICRKNVFSNQEYRWCVKCSNNLLHVDCLRAIGRPVPECLRCEDIKIKKQGVYGGGGEPLVIQMIKMTTLEEDLVGLEDAGTERRNLQRKMLSLRLPPEFYRS